MQALHDIESEVQTEMADEGQEGGPGGAILSGPNITQTLYFLVLTVYWAEELPMMDTMTTLGGSGIDAIVQLELG